MKENKNFTENENGFKIGYWNANEVKHFHSQIINTFGTSDDIRERFWTIKEKKDYQTAVEESKGETFGISNHNPSSSGI